MEKEYHIFWWKFDFDDNRIIIKSDNDKYPVIRKIHLLNKDASNEIDEAEKFVDDLISGRLNIKDAFNKYKE